MGRSENGSDASLPLGELEEQPEHEVWVDAFALDTFEVTVGRFRAFVQAFDGTLPAENAGAHPSIQGSGWQSAWDQELPASRAKLLADLEAAPAAVGGAGAPSPIFPGIKTWTKDPAASEDKPINFVGWSLAFAFCVWDGGRLPTEAEWEAAAAGGDGNRLYPWGGESPEAKIAPSCVQIPPASVGQFPAGKGRWGHVDLAGGVKEWVLDWYGEQWYAQHSAPDSCHNCACLEPFSAPGSNFRVARGGSCLHADVRAASRGAYHPVPRGDNGFRCARAP